MTSNGDLSTKQRQLARALLALRSSSGSRIFRGQIAAVSANLTVDVSVGGQALYDLDCVGAWDPAPAVGDLVYGEWDDSLAFVAGRVLRPASS